jgi:2-desacetyl-2-hydroxyethyl bacteriochlorophyllide A dehydrogenase
LKALVVEKPNSFAIKDVPYPEPGPGEVTIKVKACCVCGTDIHTIQGDVSGTRYPVIPGHEFSGTVDKVGPRVSGVAVGDRVSIEPFIACGHCQFCKTGEYNVCDNGHVIGMSASGEHTRLDGGFAEYVTVPLRNVYVFKNASFLEASFLPNLNTVVYGLRKVGFKPGDNILVVGAGTMGLLYVQLAKASGSPLVAITDRAQNRLDLASELGADAAILADADQDRKLGALTEAGFDVVVECVGSAVLMEQCLRYVRKRGKVLLFGMTPQDQVARVKPLEISKKNLEIYGSFSAAFCGKATRDLIDNGIIKIDPLITHRFALGDFDRALEQAKRPAECIRVVVEP